MIENRMIASHPHGSDGMRPAAARHDLGDSMLGSIKWYGGFNAKTEKENTYGFVSSGGEDLYFNKSSAASDPSLLVENALVALRRRVEKNGKVSAFDVRLVADLNDAEMPGFLSTKSNLTPRDVLSVVLCRAALPDCHGIIIEALKLCDGFPAAATQIDSFWFKFPPSSPYCPYFEAAPVKVKKAVCKRHFGGLLQALTNLIPATSEQLVQVSGSDLYAGLDNADRRIASQWAKGDSESEIAKMLSARSAEKAVKALYERIGLSVRDVSIEQLGTHRGDWLTHDLLIDDSTPIDVKNSRRPVNSKTFYVEHIIPEFKQNRRGVGVEIAGVISPYLNLINMNNPHDSAFNIGEITFLGTTTSSRLKATCTAFTSTLLQVACDTDKLYPHWVFSFPNAWYAELNANIGRVRSILPKPTEGEWVHILHDEDALLLLPAMLVAGMDVPDVITSGLNRWQESLASRLAGISAKGAGAPDRTALYLLLLSDFLQAISEQREGYSPDQYKRMVYAPGSKNRPMGAIDTVDLISSLIEALNLLWKYRHESNIVGFNTFKFTGLGVLKGKGSAHPRWTTMVAHCGGMAYEKNNDGEIQFDNNWRPKFRGKCGYKPLVIGNHDTCQKCLKLVCEKCGYCDNLCNVRRLGKLRDEKKEKLRKANARAAKGSITCDDGQRWEVIPIEAYEE